MSKDDVEWVRGGGNVIHDLGIILASPMPTSNRTRAVLAAGIIETLDNLQRTARAAEQLTAVAHTDLSRIRNAKLGRFTLDRGIIILGKIDRDVQVSIDVKPRRRAKAA